MSHPSFSPLHGFWIATVLVAACGSGAPTSGTGAGASAAREAPHRESPEVHLTGAGDPALDVPAVQAAVTAGGRVRLAGTFDFGPQGQVVITRDVAIRGDDGATIRGGFQTFYSPLPPLPITAPGPSIAIRGLTFDGALRAPLHLAHARAVEVRGNRIRNVHPLVTPPNPAIPVPGFQVQAGILLGTYYAYRPAVVPGGFTGPVVVSGNEIEMTGSAPERTLCQGIFLSRGQGVRARIVGNTVSGCSRNAIEVLDNVLDSSGGGRIDIAWNHIHAPATGVPYPNPSRPNGIIAGWFFDPGGAVDPARNVPHRIRENDITCDGPQSAGIFASTAGARVAENRVALAGGAHGIVVSSPGARIVENTVTGSGLGAIALVPFFPAVPAVRPDDGRLACNVVAGFTASDVDLWLAGDRNVVSGFTGSVRDTGAGNLFWPGEDCDDED